MPIEIQELSIKSVVSGDFGDGSPGNTREDAEKLREAILAECRQMILDLMRGERER